MAIIDFWLQVWRKQWGLVPYSTANYYTYTATFPVAFTTKCYYFDLQPSWPNGDGAGTVNFEVTNSYGKGLTVSGIANASFWMAMGKQQQWGYTTWTEGGNPVNVTLPLPFPKNDYLIVACAYGGIDNFHTAALNTVTSNITSNAKYQLAAYDYNRRYNYIAIGF